MEKSHMNRAIELALSEIENAQLVRRTDEHDALIFKHALIQDMAYLSMMRHDRKRLHLLVGEALERAYPERLQELAPRLAEHFSRAGETERALAYFERAAHDAAAHYANAEALTFYGSALQAAETLQTDTRDSLLRARGVVYERIGEFDRACADFDQALRLAQQQGDRLAEWQTLMDLGFAWAARDYARTGEYYEQALDLARVAQDTARVAHTLNRVGNWYLNRDEPLRALAYHYEALKMFEGLDDMRGVAETHDLLGMTNFIGADYVRGKQHADTALALFETLGDRWAIVNTTIVNYLRRALIQGDTLPTVERAPLNQDECLAILAEIRQFGSRANDAFASVILGEAAASIGEYGRALEMEERGHAVAHEINHRQWMAGTMIVQGAICTRILNFELAVELLEKALPLARELRSMHWIHEGIGFLASARIAQNELDRAAELLDENALPHLTTQTQGQRQVWASRIELALARQQPHAALALLDTLLQDTANLKPETVIPRLWILRARALMQIGTNDALAVAENLLHAARAEAQDTTQPGWEWQSDAYLAQLYRLRAHDNRATQAAQRAQALVEKLAETIRETNVRDTFTVRAHALIWNQ